VLGVLGVPGALEGWAAGWAAGAEGLELAVPEMSDDEVVPAFVVGGGV
jgi:hypothetical protein